MGIKWFIVLGIVILLPAIMLSCLAQKIEYFRSALQKAHCITGKWRVVTEKNLLFPSKVRKKLESMHRCNAETIQCIIAEQRKMILCFFVYGVLGIIYWAIWLLWLKENQSYLETPSCALLFLGLWLAVFHIFWIAPLVYFDRQREALGNENCDLLQIIADVANKGPTGWLRRNSNYAILFIAALITTMLFQCIYLTLWSKFAIKLIDSSANYVMALFILMAYQYIIQKGIAYLFKKIIARFKLSKYVGQFARYNTLYQLLKNATYLSYVFITIPVIEIDDSFTVSVIGSLFLIDTFFDKWDTLREKLTDAGKQKNR